MEMRSYVQNSKPPLSVRLAAYLTSPSRLKFLGTFLKENICEQRRGKYNNFNKQQHQKAPDHTEVCPLGCSTWQL